MVRVASQTLNFLQNYSCPFALKAEDTAAAGELQLQYCNITWKLRITSCREQAGLSWLVALRGYLGMFTLKGQEELQQGRNNSSRWIRQLVATRGQHFSTKEPNTGTKMDTKLPDCFRSPWRFLQVDLKALWVYINRAAIWEEYRSVSSESKWDQYQINKTRALAYGLATLTEGKTDAPTPTSRTLLPSENNLPEIRKKFSLRSANCLLPGQTKLLYNCDFKS